MVIYVDVDNTICKTEGVNYREAVPVKKTIEKINELHDKGNMIVYWTSRGYLHSDIIGKYELRKLTLNQLKKWGCKFDMLRMDKPAFDMFYDDKAFNVESI